MHHYKLRNALEKDGWSVGALLLHTLLLLIIRKMFAKTLQWVGGWSKNYEKRIT